MVPLLITDDASGLNMEHVDTTSCLLKLMASCQHCQVKHRPMTFEGVFMLLARELHTAIQDASLATIPSNMILKHSILILLPFLLSCWPFNKLAW
jgi:hypothetical protein